MDGMGFQRHVRTARRGEELFLGELASHASFWSLTGRRTLAAGRQPCSGAQVIITPLSTQQSKSHSHISANSFYSPAKEWGCSAQSRTRRDPSLQHTSNSPNRLLIFSLGSIPVSLKEGSYHLEALYASSFQTLLSHFPWAGSHFRFASWDSAPGLIPAHEPSFMSEWAGWSCGTLQCALMQVVLGKVLPDFCREVQSDSVKAEWWQSSDFQLLLMFISWWVSSMFKNILNACGGSKKWCTSCFAYFFWFEF